MTFIHCVIFNDIVFFLFSLQLIVYSDFLYLEKHLLCTSHEVSNSKLLSAQLHQGMLSEFVFHHLFSCKGFIYVFIYLSATIEMGM